MSEAQPIHTTHSIQEVVFVFHFPSPHTPEEVLHVLNDCTTLEGRYDVIRQLKKYEVALPDEGTPQTQGQPELGGLKFFNDKPNGQDPDWIVRFERDFLSVNVLNYDRWENVWEKAKEDLKAVANIIVGPSKPIIGITLQYIDLFIDDDISDYRLDEIINTRSKYIPQNVCDLHEPYWHVHQGWFSSSSEIDKKSPRLNRLNISAGENTSKKHQTQIDHQQLEQYNEDDQIVSPKGLFLQNEEGSARIDNIFSSLHDGNKEILRDLLTQEAQNAISLNN